jgi:hypothetical protein
MVTEHQISNILLEITTSQLISELKNSGNEV